MSKIIQVSDISNGYGKSTLLYSQLMLAGLAAKSLTQIPIFTIPSELARLYIGILKYKDDIIGVKRGINFVTIYFAFNSEGIALNYRLKRPVVLGNIFD